MKEIKKSIAGLLIFLIGFSLVAWVDSVMIRYIDRMGVESAK